MKKLYGLLFLSLTLLFNCKEKENTPKDRSETIDPISAVMPKSRLLYVDSIHLYALRDSNFTLYQLSKQQGKYQEAMRYNAEYRLYNDSILKIQRNRELAEIRAAYNHEKLIGEKNQLTLEKTRIQTFWLTVLITCLIIGGTVTLLYQRRMIRKIRAIRNASKRLQELTDEIAWNRLTIQSNENLILTISEQLDQQIELEEHIHEQQADIKRINKINEQLRAHNKRLENEVKKHSSLSQEIITEQVDLDHLLEENRILESKEKYFLELLIRKLNVAGSLKQNPRSVTPEESKQLMDETETIYPGFVTYLRKTFPKLSDLDLLTCCLIKLKFTIPQIALITNIDIASVSKRKLRIKETMRLMIPDIWDKGESLDLYIYKLTDRREKRL